jgi:hypothetical protein
MDLTDDELRLVLAGLFELRITHLENDEMWERTTILAEKLHGGRTAMFYGAPPPERIPT